MTPEERIAALEARAAGMEEWLRSIDKKLDEVIAAMNMGKGAWLAVLKLGGVLVVIVGGLAWLGDKLHLWK